MFFSATYVTIYTEHGVEVELLAHVIEFLPEFGIGFDLILIPLGEIIKIGLEVLVCLFNLYEEGGTIWVFFSI